MVLRSAGLLLAQEDHEAINNMVKATYLSSGHGGSRYFGDGTVAAEAAVASFCMLR